MVIDTFAPVMQPRGLPPSIRVIVRGWLNCNQIVMLARGDNVLIDSGYCTHRERTLELLAGPAGLDGQPLERLINTHCHTDHMGGNAAVASAYGCRITIPVGEAPHVRPWTSETGSVALFGHKADPFHFDDTIGAGECFEGGGFEWEAHAAPGHDMDALMFFEPMNRILVSGDALWENGMGFIWPTEGDNDYIDAARETLATIEDLNPAIVIPGHGEPFADSKGSIASVRSRLDAFDRDPVKNARHGTKVMFVYALLEEGSMSVSRVPAYLAQVPFYTEVSKRFLGLEPDALSAWLLADLQRGGAISIADGTVRPTMAA
jgi:glyoxylase-like metal-dependent hydrolase (beta-lactamase superfamily II)